MIPSIAGVDIGVVIGGGIRGTAHLSITTIIITTALITITDRIMDGIVHRVRNIRLTAVNRIVTVAVPSLREVRLRQVEDVQPWGPHLRQQRPLVVLPGT